VDTLPRIVRRRSPISGWGVYAGQPIPEDTFIVKSKGALVSQAEAWRREQRYLPRQRIWIFVINDRWARDAAYGGNIGRYINHACRPNCFVEIVGRHISTLNAACQRHWGFDLRNRSLDTMDLALHLEGSGAFADHERIREFTLDSLCEMFAVIPHDRHTAGGDAFITAQVFLRLLRLASRNGRDRLAGLCEPFLTVSS
jgi:hypothetical protein